MIRCQQLRTSILQLIFWTSLVSGWSYHEADGVNAWPILHPNCKGKQQSPVNIQHNNTFYKQFNAMEFTGYSDVELNLTLQNTGHSIQVLLANGLSVEGAGLDGKYTAAQFHFHWGKNDRQGSEHWIHGRRYPMEMHIVHFSKKYPDLKTAMNKKDGLAVLAFFFKVTDRKNEHFDEILNNIDKVTHRSNTFMLKSWNMEAFLPRNRSEFYRYEGSLTTPPCSESVVWTVFKNPISVAESQLTEFRRNVDENEITQKKVLLVDNFRSPQPLYGRKIYQNWPTDTAAAGHVTSPLLVSIALCVIWLSLIGDSVYGLRW